MNIQKAQAEITNIVEAYRASDYKGGRNQYPASKWMITKAEELGILELIPNAPFSSTPGHAEMKLILAAAEAGGKQVGGMIDGEGDVITTGASALYLAINEVEETQSEIGGISADNSYNEVIEINMEKPAMKIRKGDTVRVLPHTTYQHLVLNAVVSNPIEHQHNGYKSVTVTGIMDDGMGSYSIEIETAGGMIDYIPMEYIEKITGE